MKIKLLASAVLLLFVSGKVIAQSVEDLVDKGIQYHDKGNYEKAVAVYKEALEIDPESSLLNYEIALSYFSKEDYKNAIKHSDIVLEQNNDYLLQAYMTKGSALDMLGESKAAIKLFEKALRKTEKNYLLFYNLALTYYKINDLKNAEGNVIKAIEQEPNHSSSHLVLANIHNLKGNVVQTLLATHYFLFLEPNSPRSKDAFQMLTENVGGNVSKDSEKPNTINISVSPNNDNDLGAAELMVSMLEASKSLEENKEKTDYEMFIENTDSFFTTLGELKKKKNKEIWWAFYTTFFYDLAKSDHLETYCNYIRQSSDGHSKEWLVQNEKKVSAFDNWLRNN